MSFVSSKGNTLCRFIKIELYKIFAIINRAIKGLHCIYSQVWYWQNASMTQTKVSQKSSERIMDAEQSLYWWFNARNTPLLLHWSYIFLALTYRYLTYLWCTVVHISWSFIMKSRRCLVLGSPGLHAYKDRWPLNKFFSHWISCTHCTVVIILYTCDW